MTSLVLTDAEAEAARQHVAAVVSRSKTSFLSGMRVLPKPRREAMYAIYAFCREVDDVADEPGPLDRKLIELAEWREEIARLYAGRPTRPTTRALVGPIRDYRLPEAEFLALIDGMEMDARGPVRAPDEATLTLYCRRVAGAVGLLSIHAFGAEGPEAERLAVTLGEALQLTNILRDLDEDAADGRLYLPREALRAAGIESDDPAVVLRHPALPQVCDRVGAWAEARFAESEALFARLPKRSVRPAVLMAAVYRRLLRRMSARGWQQPAPRLSLPKWEKLWILLRHGVF